MAELPSGTVTFLFTDIEGGGGGAAARLGAGPRASWPRSGQRRGPGPGTRLWEQQPEAMREALARHDALAAALIEQHDGTLVKSRGEGDSLFAVFAQPGAAVAAACALQQALLSEPWPAATPLRVRIALHTGEADRRGGDYYGASVNRCARLRAVAHGGQVLFSQATADLVRGDLPEGASLRDLGTHRLKDLQQPEHLFQLLHPALPADFPLLRSLEALSNFGYRAQDEGEEERAARLFGAAEALLDPISALRPDERAERERSVASVRAALGEEAFAAAWAAGRTMPLDEAVADASEGPDG